METTPMVPWYLDSDADDQGDPRESIAARFLVQPWRAYWPPKSVNVLELWRRSEHPEALSWQFNHKEPFDRPWRLWTKSACAQKEQCAVTTDRQAIEPNGSLKNDYSIEQTPCAYRIFDPRLTNSLKSTGCLDEQIKLQKFPSVTPGSFFFLTPLGLYHSEKPYLSRLPYIPELKRTNIATQSRPLTVFDVSGNESFFRLDESGFQFAKSPIALQQWDDSAVCSEYIPLLKDWLKKHLNCSKVFIYAYNFRGQRPNTGEKKSSKAPFLRAHCDATAKSCLKRLQLYFPKEASTLMKGRVRFLNVWRPISTPVQKCPLAFCDARTVRPEDLVSVDIVFPHYLDEAYEVLYNPDHRWFYKKGMEWDDVLLFKLGDNRETEAPFCPHSAFIDPSVPMDAPDRVSIEVRAIVIG